MKQENIFLLRINQESILLKTILGNKIITWQEY